VSSSARVSLIEVESKSSTSSLCQVRGKPKMLRLVRRCRDVRTMYFPRDKTRDTMVFVRAVRAPARCDMTVSDLFSCRKEHTLVDDSPAKLYSDGAPRFRLGLLATAGASPRHPRGAVEDIANSPEAKTPTLVAAERLASEPRCRADAAKGAWRRSSRPAWLHRGDRAIGEAGDRGDELSPSASAALRLSRSTAVDAAVKATDILLHGWPAAPRSYRRPRSAAFRDSTTPAQRSRPDLRAGRPGAARAATDPSMV